MDDDFLLQETRNFIREERKARKLANDTQVLDAIGRAYRLDPEYADLEREIGLTTEPLFW